MSANLNRVVSSSYFFMASADAPALGFCGGRGFSGAVATSTENSLVSSKAFLRSGVVARQLWLFWPSTMSTLIGSPADRVEARATAEAVARRKWYIGESRGRLGGGRRASA